MELCPAHQFESVGSCTRCGRFVCAQCLTDLGSCPECLPQLTAARSAMRWPAVSAMSGMALTLIGNLASWPLAWFAPGVLRWKPSAEVNVFGGVYSFGLQLVWMVSGVLFLIWFHGVVKRTGPVAGVSPGVAVAMFFFPFVNIYNPYLYMRRIAQHVKAPGALVQCWWGTWLLATIGGRIVEFSSRGTALHQDSWLTRVDLGSRWGFLVMCALSIALILTLERRLQQPASPLVSAP